MHIVVILAFVITLTVTPMFTVPAGWLKIALGVGGYLAGVVLLGLIDRKICLAPLKHTDDVPAAIIRKHRRLTGLSHFWLIAGMAALATLGIRYKIAADWGLGNLPLLGELVLLSPFFVAVLMMWLIGYDFHRTVRQRIAAITTQQDQAAPPVWTRWQYINYSARHNLLFIAVPICLIIACTDAIELYIAPLLPKGDLGDGLLIAIVIATVLAIFVLAPMLVVRIWKTKPLPPGELRDSLETMCREMGISCRKILIWQSGGVLANAGAMGLIAPVRYFLITDALLNEMDPLYIRAIFAHELGHIQGRHLPYLGLFALSSATLASAGAWLIGLAMPVGQEVQELATLSILAVFWAFGFGFVSKRFERQSDVIGAWAADPARPANASDPTVTPVGASIFVAALHQVAMLNGIPTHQRNWRHGRMCDRLNYIQNLGHNEGSRLEVDRLVRRIKLTLWLALVVGIATTVAMSICENSS